MIEEGLRLGSAMVNLELYACSRIIVRTWRLESTLRCDLMMIGISYCITPCMFAMFRPLSLSITAADDQQEPPCAGFLLRFHPSTEGPLLTITLLALTKYCAGRETLPLVRLKIWSPPVRNHGGATDSLCGNDHGHEEGHVPLG